jgi:hypothetical protein
MNDFEQAAMDLLKKQFANVEEWLEATLRYMIAMAKERIWRDRDDGGQGTEAESEAQ